MTTADPDQTSDEPVATHYLFSLDEAIEHLRAADLLGFGVRLSSHLEPAGDETFSTRWQFEVLAESPVWAADEDDEAV